jgi:hypothetical protein
MDRAPEVDAPATTRLGPPGGPDRRLRLAIALIGVGLAFAVLKPWDLVPSPPSTPDDRAPASAGPGPADPASSLSTPWTGIGDHLACFSSGAWTAVVDELDDGRVTRSWTRVEPGPATGPGDPTIVRLHAYAEAVPRMGFCPPAATVVAGRPRPAEVDVWRLVQDGAGIDEYAAVGRRVVADDRTAGGMLLAPAGPPASREPTRAARASWPPGTYVFRVRLPGTAPDDVGGSWFAVELRGPWPGLDTTPSPTPEPMPAPATPAPTSPG